MDSCISANESRSEREKQETGKNNGSRGGSAQAVTLSTALPSATAGALDRAAGSDGTQPVGKPPAETRRFSASGAVFTAQTGRRRSEQNRRSAWWRPWGLWAHGGCYSGSHHQCPMSWFPYPTSFITYQIYYTSQIGHAKQNMHSNDNMCIELGFRGTASNSRTPVFMRCSHGVS